MNLYLFSVHAMKKKRIYDRRPAPTKEESPSSGQFDAQPIQKVLAPPPFAPSSSGQGEAQINETKAFEKSESGSSPVETSALASSFNLDSSGPSSEKEASLEGTDIGQDTLQLQSTDGGSQDAADKGGGAYGRLKNVKTKNPDEKTEKHHTPSKAAYKQAGFSISGYLGSAIRMQKNDHRSHFSTGNSKLSKNYRLAEVKLLEEGKFIEAFEFAAAAVRLTYGNQYDAYIEQAKEQFVNEIVPRLEEQFLEMEQNQDSK